MRKIKTLACDRNPLDLTGLYKQALKYLEMGQVSAEMGQVSAEMGQVSAEMGQVSAEMGQVSI